MLKRGRLSVFVFWFVGVLLLLSPVLATFQLPSYCQFQSGSRYLMVTFTSASECIRFTQYSNVLVTGGTTASNCSIATACYTTVSNLFSTNFSGVGLISVIVSASNAQITFGSAQDCIFASNSSGILLSSQQSQTPSSCSSAGVLTVGSSQVVPTSNLFFSLVNQPSSVGLVDIVG